MVAGPEVGWGDRSERRVIRLFSSIRRRETMFATLVSISRTMVNQPRTNTVGRTVKASAANARGEELENPSATSPLASEER